ncbi:MAG TPA: prolipoprotein diacylglyceryl transferase family protein, partial [Actinomycetota bacterium]|nr:prolipoprotein diacylglyceryl transferase family protein [Actinomycetota bacterium]
MDPLALHPPLAAIGWPVLDRLRFGDLAISPHGIGIAVGFLIGARVLVREGPKRGVSVDDINTMLVWAILGAIAGARFFYVVAHWSEFDGLLDALAIWRGGISLLGGIAGAILVNLPLLRRRGYRFFQVMDGAVIGLALGIGIGRIGDLVIGDHLGIPTSWFLAWTYEGGTLAPPFSCAAEVCRAVLQGGRELVITRESATLLAADGRVLAEGVGVHQTALYDLLSAWPLFATLSLLNRVPRREGVLTLTFGLWYGAARVVTDFLRVDKRFFGLTGSQWTALTVAVVCAVTLLVWAVRSRARAEAAG